MESPMLTLDKPTSVASICFADAIGVTALVRLLEEAEQYAIEAVYDVKF